MKAFAFFTFLCCSFISVNLFAQTPKAIEADLLRTFKKIDYWEEKGDEDATGNVRMSGNLEKANAEFGKKLKYYVGRYPSTIAQNFPLLKNAHLDISTSDDSLFRIYSWDTSTGGTMHFFESVFQYKSGAKTIAILDTPKTEGDSEPDYYKMYTFKTNDQTYYLAIYTGIESSRYYFEGIKVFSIANAKLNDDTKILKTKTGLHSQIFYEYDFGSVMNWKDQPSIYFDQSSETIHIPVVKNGGIMTHQYIIYKFTGQYFERVKN